MESFRNPGLYRKGKRFFTENLCPGETVYGESLEKEGDREFRSFDPFHSKLSAYVAKGGREWPFKHAARILYLGAGSGTTVSHLSDILPRAHIYAVERFPRPYASLMRLSKLRDNVYPILADAQLPERYRHIVGEVDLIYQDVAQRNQVQILVENVRASLDPDGQAMVQLKTRSITQSDSPRTVLRAATREAEDAGLTLIETLDLSPFSRDHFTMILEPGTLRD